MLMAAGATAAAARETVLVETGSVYAYLDDGSDQGTEWTAVDFDDSTWSTGAAELGYGDDDETTIVGFGPDPDDKFPTTYFRHSFDIPDPSVHLTLQLRLLRDDGAVVYLNGLEVHRSNMPDGPIDYLTFASTTASGSEEEVFYTSSLDPSSLVVGKNTIAVEIHQRDSDSSDISFDLELVGADTVEGVVRGPYLQMGGAESIVVRWSTDSPTDGAVRFGSAPDALDQVAIGDPQVFEHEVALVGLSPQTTYYYAVGTPDRVLAGRDFSHFFVTSPRPGAPRPVRVWVLGDSGTANSDAEAVRDAYKNLDASRHTDLLLLLGDNAYEDGTDDEYQEALFDMYPEILRSSAVFSTMGNHDGHTADSSSQSGPYYEIFSLPSAGELGGVPSGTEAYYSFDFGNIHFICVDSDETGSDPGDPMMVWLEDDLAANDARWTIAFWHHPAYSKGSHDSDTSSQLIDMRVNVLPLLEEYGVDLILSGHSHSYERSFLLDRHYGDSDTLDDSMKIDAGDGRVGGDGAYDKPSLSPAPHEGAVFIAAGSSGQISGGPLNHPVMIESLNQLGSVVLDVQGDTLGVEFLRDDGTVQDHFTMLKGGALPPIDLTVTPATISPGEDFDIVVSGLSAGETVFLVLSRGGLGEGPCPPVAGGLCVDIVAPFAGVFQAVADDLGTATWSLSAPGGVASRRYPLQAVAERGPGGAESVKSNVGTLLVE